MKKYCIDGDFFSYLDCGIGRYAYNILEELDKICEGKDISIYVSGNAHHWRNYKNIRVIKTRKKKFWTQLVFGMYTRVNGMTPVTLCNEASYIAKPGIACLHDVCYAESEDIFPQIKDIPQDEIAWFKKVYQRIRKKSYKIITVSEFSKGRIMELLGVEADRIAVIGNGWQHFEAIEEDGEALKNLSIEAGSYYLTVTSPNKNKNVNWVLECAKFNPDETFVIAGRNMSNIIAGANLNNVIYADNPSDSAIKSYMKDCKAFIFPSYYEGFGIPPLEALSLGCRIIISDRASLPEIFGESAIYISPDDPYVNLNELMKQETHGAEEVLEKYSWAKQAAKLNELLV